MKPRNARDTRAGPRVGQQPRNRGDPPAGSLDDLRRLVLGPEQQRIARLEQQLPVTAEEVGRVLPEAVNRNATPPGNQLAIALEPPVTAAVRSVAHRDPQLFGEILAPTIGAAVRKAVGEAVAAMMQRFDEALEQSLSLRAISWRIEARRTGRPFAEVVLLHTLVYRVEQVLLIHSQTGLLLEHVVAEGVGAKDPDQVAAMLAAIDAFVHEAFRPEPASVRLSSMQVGDLVVWVDRDESFAIAAVVRGVVPREFGGLLREVRERIYLAHQSALMRSQPNVGDFAGTRPMLERCLCTQRQQPAKRARLVFGLLAAIVFAAVGVFVVRALVSAADHAHTLDTYVETFAAQPGISITSAEHVDGRVRISGFRDPLAPRPAELLQRRGLAPAELHFAPFYSLDPSLVERRAHRALGPPASVSLAVDGGTLRAAGSAPRTFIERARLLALALPGVEHYDDSALRAEEALEALRTRTAALQALSLSFARGSSKVPAHSVALEQVALRTHDLIAAARDARVDLCVGIAGHADMAGSEDMNQRLRALRAIHTAEALRARGVEREFLRAAPASEKTNAAPARSASFQVDLGKRCMDER